MPEKVLALQYPVIAVIVAAVVAPATWFVIKVTRLDPAEAAAAESKTYQDRYLEAKASLGQCEGARELLMREIDRGKANESSLRGAVDALRRDPSSTHIEVPESIELLGILLGTEKDKCGGEVLEIFAADGSRVQVRPGETKQVSVTLDTAGFFQWTCDGSSERTRPSWPGTNIIVCRRASGSRDITWACYRKK